MKKLDFSKGRKLFGDGKARKIVLAKQIKTNKYESNMNILLEMMGHGDALATDESKIWDFTAFMDDVEQTKFFKKMEKKLGFSISEQDYLVDIAKRMD